MLTDKQSAASGLMAQHRCHYIYGVFTRSSKRPANFQQMYSKYTC